MPSAADPALRCTEHELLANGIRLRYVEMGEGPLVVLLHGFPDFWCVWREQLPALAAAGFRAVAPDLRGYNRSDKPPGVRAYGIPLVAADVAALIGALGSGRAAAVIGHDWGGVVGWHLAAHRAELLARLVVVNAPHPAVFARELRTPRQMMRSWYAAFFQLPWLPELVLRAGDYALLLRAVRRHVRRLGAVTERDLARQREALAQPGALTAALNYYRAAGRRLWRRGPRALPGHAPVLVRTLVIWGERDPFLGVRLTEGLERWVPVLRVVRLPDAGHWVQLDDPAAVNAALLEWLQT